MKLQVYKIEEGFIAVDKDRYTAFGEYYLRNGNLLKNHINANILLLRGDSGGKVIATDTSFKLEGVPQFELEKWDVFTSESCLEEKCSMCENPARAKIGEEIMHDDPKPIRHNWTAYVCSYHFDLIFRPFRAGISLDEIIVESEIVPSIEERAKITVSEEHPDGLLSVKSYIYNNGK